MKLTPEVRKREKRSKGRKGVKERVKEKEEEKT